MAAGERLLRGRGRRGLDRSRPERIGGGAQPVVRYTWDADRWRRCSSPAPGSCFTDEPVPPGETTRNFSPQVGVGLQYLVRERVAIGGEYRFHHLSNKGATETNPEGETAFNFTVLTALGVDVMITEKKRVVSRLPLPSRFKRQHRQREPRHQRPHDRLGAFPSTAKGASDGDSGPSAARLGAACPQIVLERIAAAEPRPKAELLGHVRRIATHE